MGATRNIFFPNIFRAVIWIISEPLASTSGNAMIGSMSTESVKNAMTVNVVVSPIIPVSPIQNLAGGTLNHKNASRKAVYAVYDTSAKCRYHGKYKKWDIPGANKEISHARDIYGTPVKFEIKPKRAHKRDQGNGGKSCSKINTPGERAVARCPNLEHVVRQAQE